MPTSPDGDDAGDGDEGGDGDGDMGGDWDTVVVRSDGTDPAGLADGAPQAVRTRAQPAATVRTARPPRPGNLTGGSAGRPVRPR